MTRDELITMLKNHQEWLDGTGGERLNLSGEILRDVDLVGANLEGADLRGADLRGASLRGAEFYGARVGNSIFYLKCPETGSFIAWKKLQKGLIAKLLIPEHAKRSSATSRKCRASEALVLAIDDGNKEFIEGISRYDDDFKYIVGETVFPDFFDDDRWNECSAGIHFFTTRREAERY